MAQELEAARRHGYRYGVARATWMLGLSAFVQGRHGQARGFYEDTLIEFESLKDVEQVAAAHNLLASLFHYLGDETAAWEHMTAALSGLDVTQSLKLRHGLLINAALIVRTVSEEAALDIQDEVVRNAAAWGREGAIAEAHAQRASILANLNRRAQAANELNEARLKVAASQDQAMRSRVEMIVLLAETDLLRDDQSRSCGEGRRDRDRSGVGPTRPIARRATPAEARPGEHRVGPDRGSSSCPRSRHRSIRRRAAVAVRRSTDLLARRTVGAFRNFRAAGNQTQRLRSRFRVWLNEPASEPWRKHGRRQLQRSQCRPSGPRWKRSDSGTQPVRQRTCGVGDPPHRNIRHYSAHEPRAGPATGGAATGRGSP